MTNNAAEETLIVEIESLREDMTRIARTIYAKPELGYQEYTAARLLSDFLGDNGFEVTRNIAGMETAFIASSGNGKAHQHTVAFLAEYDALPKIGHGCGHNLIGTAAVGAAAGLIKAFPNIEGKIIVLGCPAEEAGIDHAGGKVRLVEEGYFQNVDAAMIFHPMPLTAVGGRTAALIGLEFEFDGKAAHAAGNPWEGINALDGVLLTYNAINAMRQHVKEDVRMHGIVTKGGDAPNIVPDHAATRFFIRSQDSEYLKATIKKVKDCAKGAALATGTKLKINRFNNFYAAMNTNSLLADLLANNLKKIGLRIEGKKKGKGSTDFGNVSCVVPACELSIRLGSGIYPHTPDFAEAANSDEGIEVMLRGAKVLALSAFDLFQNPALLMKAKQEFKKNQQ